MTADKARWLLAAAIAKFKQAGHILRVYEPVLSVQQRQELIESRANLDKVATAAMKRLRGEYRA